MSNIDDMQLTDSKRKIHTPSAFAKKNLLYAQETGSLRSLKMHSCVRENMDSYLFFIVKDGKGVVATGGKEYNVVKGQAVLLDCHKRYSHTSDKDEPWEIRWIHFNGAMMATLFPLFEEGNSKCPVFETKNLGTFEAVMEELEAKLESRKAISEINQSALIERLVIECLNRVIEDRELTVDSNDGKMDASEFTSLRESVNEHISEAGLERILSIQYGIEPEKLSKLFEEKYGISLPDYIINRKLNKAKELLRFTIKSIPEIVEESGMNTEEEFRKRFMEIEEMQPEEYRKKWAQWIKS